MGPAITLDEEGDLGGRAPATPGYQGDHGRGRKLTPTLAAVCAYASTSHLSGIAHLRGCSDGRLAALVRRDQPRGRAGQRPETRPDRHAAPAQIASPYADHRMLRRDPGPGDTRHHGRRHRLRQDAATFEAMGFLVSSRSGSASCRPRRSRRRSDGRRTRADVRACACARRGSPAHEGPAGLVTPSRWERVIIDAAAVTR